MIGTSHKKAVLLAAWILAALGPLLYNRTTYLFFSPDIQYVKAKTLRILAGSLYADPVTGFPTFHPPFYHLFLAAFQSLGISIDFLLMAASVVNAALIFFFTYKIITRLFDDRAAFWTCLLIPFIIEFNGCGNLLLATAFYFSIPFYLAGLWIFIHPRRTTRQTVLASFLWGLAFLISPGYLFLIGLTLLYELAVAHRVRQTIIAAAVLLVTLIPFFIQTYVIFSYQMFGTSAFSFWRGFPDLGFAADFLRYVVDPTEKGLSGVRVWLSAGLTALGLIGMIKGNGKRWYVGVAGLAFLLTFYHYNSQYAVRTYLFASLILAAYAVRFLFDLRWRKFLPAAIITGLAAIGLYTHYDIMLKIYKGQNYLMPEYKQVVADMREHLEEHIAPNDYLLAFNKTYRHYVMPNFAVQALTAHRTGEYFQLTSSISDKLQAEYNNLMACRDVDCLDYYSTKYGMRTALVNPVAIKKGPVFRVIARHWKQVYTGPYFDIYRKP